MGAWFVCRELGHVHHDCPHALYSQVWVTESRAHKKGPIKLLVPLWVNAMEAQGWSDSGCCETLVRESLVGPEMVPMGSIYLQSIHGDMRPYPIKRCN